MTPLMPTSPRARMWASLVGTSSTSPGREPDLAVRGVQVAGQQGAQVVDRHAARVHDLGLGQGGLGRRPAGLGDDGQQGSAVRFDVVGAGLRATSPITCTWATASRGVRNRMSPGASGRFWDVSAPDSSRGRLMGTLSLPPPVTRTAWVSSGACRRAAALGQQVQQVHALAVLVLPRRFGPRPQQAHLARAGPRAESPSPRAG